MDPQLLAALLSQAKGGNKNLSGVLGNMDSPILLALAQVLDPYYGTGQTTSGAGSLYGSFASDETTPAAVKAVMDYVDQGMNGYQIEAQINNLDPNVVKDSGYTDEQLISMGKEMAKEGGKKGTDVFAKAGLRNPNDIYSLEDVPLNSYESKNYETYMDKARESEKGYGDIDYQFRVAQQRLKELREQQWEPPVGAPMGGEGTSVRPMGGEGTSVRPMGGPGTTIRPTGAKGQVLKPTGAKGDFLYPTGGGGEYIPDERPEASQEDRDAVSRALANRANLETKIKGDLMRAQAVREGALNRAKSIGRTPFTDQTSALLKFIAGTK